MPLVMATSSRSRLADTVKVLDISDEEAIKLLSNSVPNQLAQKICLYVEVKSIGRGEIFQTTRTVPPTCRIAYQCKRHAISVFLKVHQ